MVRTLALSTALLCAPVLAAEPGGDGPVRIELKVGQEVSVGYVTSPICDAPRIAVLSAEGNGTLKGVGIGKTLCSGETPVGLRQVYEVVVTKPAAEPGADAG